VQYLKLIVFLYVQSVSSRLMKRDDIFESILTTFKSSIFVVAAGAAVYIWLKSKS